MSTTIENIVNKIKSALNSARPKAMNIPGIFMLCSLAKRPGLSVSVSTAITVSKLKVLGFPTGTLPDGQENMTVNFVHSMFEENYRAINEDAVMQGRLGIGDITIQATGANAGGPVTVVGNNMLPVDFNGLLK